MDGKCLSLKMFYIGIFVIRTSKPVVSYLTMLEPQDAAAPRSNPSAGNKPIACQHLAHMGRPGRQLNQQTGFSWMAKGMSEMLTAWLLPQIALEHSSKPYCRLLAPHLHSYKTVCTFTPNTELPSSSY